MQYLRVALKRNEAVNAEHTCWYSIPTLSELASRFGFVPFEFATGYGYYKPTLKWKVKKAIGSVFFKMFPQLGGSLLAAFKLNSSI
ncbi:MAG: hypothetical protein PF517_13835 [Salinivirgaceae bacterium]|jgi:hypothetical protein|nr:hypothetical protein [Salinivirgaceae bacterium]